MTWLPPHLSHLQKFADTPTPVLSDGSVQLIGVLGDDNFIVNAARISFGKNAEEFKPAANRHLLRYLLRHRHTTPLEMCELVVRIRMPMDAHRQQIRHRTANVNEYSTRYKPAIDSMDRTDPAAWRTQSKNNKQGSAGVLTEWPDGRVWDHEDKWDNWEGPGEYLTQREAELQTLAREVYEERLAFGVAREQARKDLPLSTYTEYIWKMDLHNLFHYLSLRLDSHAQLEIRSYAEAIASIVKEWVPWAWEAFEDYRLNAMFLTRFDVDALRGVIKHLRWSNGEVSVEDCFEIALRESGLSKTGREAGELRAKMSRLLES